MRPVSLRTFRREKPDHDLKDARRCPHRNSCSVRDWTFAGRSTRGRNLRMRSSDDQSYSRMGQVVQTCLGFLIGESEPDGGETTTSASHTAASLAVSAELPGAAGDASNADAFVRVPRRRMTSTINGSNCAPEHRLSSLSVCCIVSAGR